MLVSGVGFGGFLRLALSRCPALLLELVLLLELAPPARESSAMMPG